MSVQADFSPDEWSLLRELPFNVILGAIASDVHGTIGAGAKEAVVAAQELVAEGIELKANPLIAELLIEYSNSTDELTPEIELSDDAQRLGAVNQANGQSLQATALLAERADPEAGLGYRRWVYDAAEAAVKATKSGGFIGIGSKQVSDSEKQFLKLLAIALDLEIEN